MGKRELVALLSVSPWCLVIDLWLFLDVPWVCVQFVIVVFPDHTYFLFSLLKAHNICDAFCDFGACGGTTSSAENATLNDVNKF